MKLVSFPLYNLLKRGITHQILSYRKLVSLWNAKENSQKKNEINLSGLKKPIPTCRLLCSSCGQEILSARDQKPHTLIGQQPKDSSGMIGNAGVFPKND